MKTKLVTGIALGIFLLLVFNILAIAYFTQNSNLNSQNIDKTKLQTVNTTNKNDSLITPQINTTKNTTTTPVTPVKTTPKPAPPSPPIISGAS